MKRNITSEGKRKIRKRKKRQGGKEKMDPACNIWTDRPYTLFSEKWSTLSMAMGACSIFLDPAGPQSPSLHF